MHIVMNSDQHYMPGSSSELRELFLPKKGGGPCHKWACTYVLNHATSSVCASCSGMILTHVVITDTLAWKEINEHDSRYADRSHEVWSSPKKKLWHTAVRYGILQRCLFDLVVLDVGDFTMATECIGTKYR
jgi:hypothetical protein